MSFATSIFLCIFHLADKGAYLFFCVEDKDIDVTEVKKDNNKVKYVDKIA